MKFHCPNCERETFEAVSELRAMKDFVGMSCPECGYRIKKEDIQKQSIDASVEMIREKLRRAGLIK